MDYRKEIIRRASDKVPGGLADEKTEKDFDSEQLETGVEVEQEHTDDKTLAKEIAMDHLVENDKYYTFLDKLETLMEDWDDDELIKRLEEMIEEKK